ncbi:MAG: hypothetical protein JXB08_06390 [Bacilli bacterium]|nr:hypothetical protein [Bacilli bacterium]MBN2876594.1 hypothetical protein [Bacilli bacterium]
MNQINLHILTLNKYQKRHFGVDYFMNLLTGSNPLFRYYSTPSDQNPVYTPGPVSFLPEMLGFLEKELNQKEKGSVIGVHRNPDIYQGMDSVKPILNLLKKYEMGFFLETTSLKILDDIDALVAFSKELPLLIAIPTATLNHSSVLFGPSLQYENAYKILTKLKLNGLHCGLVIKPIIPMINDNLDEFLEIIKRTITIGVDYIYPTFSIKFDSRKLTAFYDIIDQEAPELLVKYHDQYGMKHAWESPNMSILKKSYVIECRKNKVLYAMKDIIDLYKPDLDIQLKLF